MSNVIKKVYKNWTEYQIYASAWASVWQATSSTAWVVKLWSDTSQSVAANTPSSTAWKTYAVQTNWSWQMVVNVPWDNTTYTSKSAVSGWTDVSLVTTWEKYNWNNKQNALSTQTAYTSKWTAKKVPTITTNTLGQVTGIAETAIIFPVTSVNGKTWALTVSEFSPSWTATTGYVVTKTANWYWWAAPSGWSTTITVTLTSAWWSSNSQTVSATGVTASNTVIVSPAPADIADYADKWVYCSAQGSGTLTFDCDTVPSGDIVVNVLIMS